MRAHHHAPVSRARPRRVGPPLLMRFVCIGSLNCHSERSEESGGGEVKACAPHRSHAPVSRARPPRVGPPLLMRPGGRLSGRFVCIGCLNCHSERSEESGGGEVNHPSLRSRHSGFIDSIRAILFDLRHALICFSRAMAARMSSVASK